MNLVQNNPSSLVVPPRFIFTCHTTQEETRSTAVIRALEKLNESASPILSTHILPTEEPRPEIIHPQAAVALFDGDGNGFYSLKCTRRFQRVRGVPAWAAGARWAVCIHKGSADRIARQLHVMFGTKFSKFVDVKILRETSPPYKPRKPRKPRHSSSHSF